MKRVKKDMDVQIVICDYYQTWLIQSPKALDHLFIGFW